MFHFGALTRNIRQCSQRPGPANYQISRLDQQARGLALAESFPQRLLAFGQKVEGQTSRLLSAELRRDGRPQVTRVLPDVFADRRALAQLVEQVVADLICRAEAFAVSGERGDIPLISARGH